MTRVLLVLRRVHTRIICNCKNQTAVYAYVRRAVQRIGSYVQADVFHAAEASGAACGCAEGNFKGDLFVRSPFSINLGVCSYDFSYFCARRPGIRGDDAHARLV